MSYLDPFGPNYPRPGDGYSRQRRSLPERGEDRSVLYGFCWAALVGLLVIGVLVIGSS